MVAPQNTNRVVPVSNGGSVASPRNRVGEGDRVVRPKANAQRLTGPTAGRMPDGDPPGLTLWGSEEWDDSSGA